MKIFPKGLRVQPTEKYCRIMNEEKFDGKVLEKTDPKTGATLIQKSAIEVEYIHSDWLLSFGIN